MGVPILRRFWRRVGIFSLAPPFIRGKNYSLNPGFTETRLRPLARRRDSTACPLLVFIRVRNPCVFERRRRFGWKVRFGMIPRLSYCE